MYVNEMAPTVSLKNVNEPSLFKDSVPSSGPLTSTAESVVPHGSVVLVASLPAKTVIAIAFKRLQDDLRRHHAASRDVDREAEPASCIDSGLQPAQAATDHHPGPEELVSLLDEFLSLVVRKTSQSSRPRKSCGFASPFCTFRTMMMTARGNFTAAHNRYRQVTR